MRRSQHPDSGARKRAGNAAHAAGISGANSTAARQAKEKLWGNIKKGTGAEGIRIEGSGKHHSLVVIFQSEDARRAAKLPRHVDGVPVSGSEVTSAFGKQQAA